MNPNNFEAQFELTAMFAKVIAKNAMLWNINFN